LTGPLAPFFVVWLCILAGCSPSGNQVQYSGSTMGTTYHVTVIGKELPADLGDQIGAVLADVNRRMSTYIDDSELMQLNRSPVGDAVRVSPQLMAVLVMAREIYVATGGAFDPSVGPLVNLWGFGPDYKPDQVPDGESIAAARAELGFDSLLLDESALTVVRQKDIDLDLSAIAKGYGADRVAELLNSQGINRYMVEVGGELALSGMNNKGSPWQIAIERPAPGARDVQVVASFSDVGVATSGDYRNYFEQDGKRYSHTIDPRTGHPITHSLASVTVVAESSAKADGLATAFMVMGADSALQFAEAHGIAIMTLSKSSEGFDVAYSLAFSPYLNEVQ
jgi:FAD:protein FMN transferase